MKKKQVRRKKIELDLHGRRVLDAEEIFYQYLNESRQKRNLIELHFITGAGKIQNRLKEMSVEFDLNHDVQLGNRGVLVVEFE